MYTDNSKERKIYFGSERVVCWKWGCSRLQQDIGFSGAPGKLQTLGSTGAHDLAFRAFTLRIWGIWNLGHESKDFRGVNHDRTSQPLGKRSYEQRTRDVMGVSFVKQLAWKLIA